VTIPYDDITLVSGVTTVTLPSGMDWIDRKKRNLVAQQRDRGANGSQIIEEWQAQGGYPITLVARGDQDEWVTQDVVDALEALADAPLSVPMTLTYNDGTTYSVRFRYESETTPAVEADPVLGYFPRDDTFNYSLTLRLIQASA
jgi:hypothetical protein